MSFTHDDVQRIIQLLDASNFDALHLEIDGLKLDLRRHGTGTSATAATASVAAPVVVSEAVSASAAAPSAPATPSSSGTPVQAAPSGNAMVSGASGATSNADLVDIRAPMLGTFYRSPKPGAEPFVVPGARVEPDTVVGIIEVMKLMNSVTANLAGEIVEVVAQDGELVEYDQVLFRVRA